MISRWSTAVREGGASLPARAELVWMHFPSSWGVFVLIGLVAAGIYAITMLYRREMNCCPAWMKMLLAGMRSLALLLIVCILLGPASVLVEKRTLEPTIVLARDASRSMLTVDTRSESAKGESARAAKPLTRADLVNGALSGNSRLISALERKGRLEVLDFANQALVIGTVEGSETLLPALEPTSGGTNLAAAIEEGLKAERPAAIVLFTDGQQTSNDDVSEAARKAKLRSVPIFAVGIGDPARPKSERVTKIICRPQAWQGEPFEIEAIVSFQGADAGERRVELFEQPANDLDRSGDGEKLVATAAVAVPEGGNGQATARFSRIANEPGRYRYRARLADSAAVPSGSEDSAVSDVVKVLSRESIRVLIVAGAPTWDYRLIQTLLSRDKTMAVSCWLQSLDAGRKQDGNKPITQLPQTKAELFEYDVILLLDPNPAGLTPEWIDLLRQFVGEHAGGLLFMAGPKYTADLLANSRGSEVTSLVPVKFGDLAASAVQSLVTTSDAAWPLVVAPVNADHPVLRFYPDREQTIRLWQSLPGVLWSFPAIEPAPTAQVLLMHGDRGLSRGGAARPLMVAGRYGSGNTLYLGLDGTWRWRSAGRQAEFFDKFWVQTVRFLAEGRSLEGRRRGYVQTDRERYDIGQRVHVSAKLLDASFEPLGLLQVNASIEQPGAAAQPLVLLPTANDGGRYEATFTAKTEGTGTVRIPLPDAAAENGLLEATFSVEAPSLEVSQTWLNRPLLEQLAQQTGGKYFDVGELDKLAAAVPNRVEKVEERGEPRPVWDVPAMLVALVGLLSAEWLLRKRCSLL